MSTNTARTISKQQPCITLGCLSTWHRDVLDDTGEKISFIVKSASGVEPATTQEQLNFLWRVSIVLSENESHAEEVVSVVASGRAAYMYLTEERKRLIADLQNGIEEWASRRSEDETKVDDPWEWNEE